MCHTITLCHTLSYFSPSQLPTEIEPLSAYLRDLVDQETIDDFTEEANSASSVCIEWHDGLDAVLAYLCSTADDMTLVNHMRTVMPSLGMGTVLLAVWAYLGRGGEIEGAALTRWSQTLRLATKADITYAMEAILDESDDTEALTGDWDIVPLAKRVKERVIQKFEQD